MSISQDQLKADWWAEGDTPVHRDSRVIFFVDGREAMLSMCLHFLRASHYIYLGNWGLTPDMELVRGTDHCEGPHGSPAQEKLLVELRAVGLSEADIAFWCTHDLSVQAVLGYAISKGVEVKVLLWDSLSLPYLSHYQPAEAQRELEAVGVTCLLDDSARGIRHHPVESLHQKISIVDGTHAYVGGVDLLIEQRGEFDRWDTHDHYFSTPLRQTKEGTTPYPWHDAHTLIQGPAAHDVEHNYRQRWNDVVERHHFAESLLIPKHRAAHPVETTSIVQVARTIPEHTYSFGPDKGIQGIAQLYAKALSNIQHFLYIENQYFWLRAYTGLDIALVGYDSPDMEYNIRKIGEALQRGAVMAIMLPDHPNVGRAFSDASLARLHEEAPEAVEQGRLQAFCLAASTNNPNGVQHYRPIYVHAKVAIIDDVWATVGSGNLNNRGMRDDTEMNVAILDPQKARGLRLMLWAEHLGMVSAESLFDLADYLGNQYQLRDERSTGAQTLRYLQETLGDPYVGLHMMVERAQDNLRRYKAGQPLIGHLLPYLTAAEAQQQGLPFREEHGWIEEP